MVSEECPPPPPSVKTLLDYVCCRFVIECFHTQRRLLPKASGLGWVTTDIKDHSHWMDQLITGVKLPCQKAHFSHLFLAFDVFGDAQLDTGQLPRPLAKPDHTSYAHWREQLFSRMRRLVHDLPADDDVIRADWLALKEDIKADFRLGALKLAEKLNAEVDRAVERLYREAERLLAEEGAEAVRAAGRARVSAELGGGGRHRHSDGEIVPSERSKSSSSVVTRQLQEKVVSEDQQKKRLLKQLMKKIHQTLTANLQRALDLFTAGSSDTPERELEEALSSDSAEPLLSPQLLLHVQRTAAKSQSRLLLLLDREISFKLVHLKLEMQTLRSVLSSESFGRRLSPEWDVVALLVSSCFVVGCILSDPALSDQAKTRELETIICRLLPSSLTSSRDVGVTSSRDVGVTSSREVWCKLSGERRMVVLLLTESNTLLKRASLQLLAAAD